MTGDERRREQENDTMAGIFQRVYRTHRHHDWTVLPLV
jgi:hypothetical protein